MRHRKEARVLCPVLVPEPGIMDIGKLSYMLNGDSKQPFLVNLLSKRPERLLISSF